MAKYSVRLLRILALALTTVALASSAQATDCVRDTTWKDANGNPLDCYHCGTGEQQVTYCYPVS